MLSNILFVLSVMVLGYWAYFLIQPVYNRSMLFRSSPGGCLLLVIGIVLAVIGYLVR